MQIFLIILGIIIILIVALILTDIKVSAKYNNMGTESRVVIRAYIFCYIRIFKMTKKIEHKKDKFEEGVKFIIDYFMKNKADPVEYAQEKVKKSKKTPKFLKNIDYSNIYIDRFSLDLLLDFGDAMSSAILAGATNGILGMTLAKYRDNIRCEPHYKVCPGYMDEGIKIKAESRFAIKVFNILKAFLKK